MDFMDAVKNRRSVRSFKETTIEEHIIEDMLASARLAPSAGNGQNHLFGVVKESKLKLALAKAAGGQVWIADAPVVIACCARLETDLKDLPENDFGLIVNQTRFGKPFLEYLNAYEDRSMVRALFANATPLIPAEHMFLTAASHGLSACFVGHVDIMEASRILRLPEDIVCLFLLPVGYPNEEPTAKRLKTIEEISFLNVFNGSGETTC
ncbi:nitroreductase family protein [Fontibacillus sp. BL9]|uniref:nitroreductase family protein n=1 Tax=Fontibacillus sp. BL9 TaxID=3389971 RepID=UPI00397DE1EB